MKTDTAAHFKTWDITDMILIYQVKFKDKTGAVINLLSPSHMNRQNQQCICLSFSASNTLIPIEDVNLENWAANVSFYFWKKLKNVCSFWQMLL